MEAFGTFFDCVARVMADDSPHAIRERMLLHLLRSAFPLARQLTSVAAILRASKELHLTPAYTEVAAIRLLCDKAASMALRMPAWEEIAALPARFAKLVKALVLSFVAHHGPRHLNRAYCVHTLGQLAADVLGRPVAIFWGSYRNVARMAPTHAITPSTGGAYFTRENAVILCCQRDSLCGQLIVVLVRSLEAPVDIPLADDLRFSSQSFEYCPPEPMYALYETTGERVRFVCNFEQDTHTEHVASLPYTPDPTCFYYVYPAAPECTQLPPLPKGMALQIVASDCVVATITEPDVYAYFRLDPNARTVRASLRSAE